MELARKLGRGVFYQGLFMVSSALLTFLLTPYLLQALGSRWYGYWIMILAFFASYELFDNAITVAVSNSLSRALGVDDREEMNAVVSTAFAIFLGYGVVVAAATVAAASVCRFLLADALELRLVREVVLIMGFGMAFNFPLKIFRGVLVSTLRYDIMQRISLGRVVAATGLMYAALVGGRGLAALATISVGCRIAESLVMILAARRVFPELDVRPARVGRRVAGELLGYGSKALLSGLAGMLRTRLDAFVVASMVSVNLVAVYDVGQRLVNSGQDIVKNSLNVMIPVFSRYEGQKDYASMREKYLALAKVSVVVSVFAGGSLLMYGQALIRRWVGSAFEESFTILAILTVPMMIEIVQSSNIQLLFGVSKHHYYAFLNLGEGIANIVLSVLLAQRYGMYGVALGTAIEVIVVKTLVLPWIACRAVDLPLRRYYVDTLLVAGGKTALPLLLYYVLVRGFIESSYPRLLLLGALQVLVLAPVIYALVLDDAERVTVRRLLTRRS